jgi:hypothetical protein
LGPALFGRRIFDIVKAQEIWGALAAPPRPARRSLRMPYGTAFAAPPPR